MGSSFSCFFVACDTRHGPVNCMRGALRCSTDLYGHCASHIRHCLLLLFDVLLSFCIWVKRLSNEMTTASTTNGKGVLLFLWHFIRAEQSIIMLKNDEHTPKNRHLFCAPMPFRFVYNKNTHSTHNDTIYIVCARMPSVRRYVCVCVCCNTQIVCATASDWERRESVIVCGCAVFDFCVIAQ